MIPKVLHQTSKSKDLTWEESYLQRHNSNMLPGWELNLWDDEDNERIVSKTFPQYFDKFTAIKRGVMKADIARLVYMHAFGGVYLDTDIKIFKPLDPIFGSNACVLGLERGRIKDDRTFSADAKIGNACFAAEKAHPFFTAMIHHVFTNLPTGTISDQELMDFAGPHGLTAFIKKSPEHHSQATVLEQHTFFPDMRLSGCLVKKRPTTVAAHLCWGSWRSKRNSVTIKNKARRTFSAIFA